MRSSCSLGGRKDGQERVFGGIVDAAAEEDFRDRGSDAVAVGGRVVPPMLLLLPPGVEDAALER
jgi:hypothetical protein